MESEGNIFDAHMTAWSIFKNKDVLRMGYTPKILLHRNEEITRLASGLSDALKAQTPSNVFICGKPGTGKTATGKYIGEQLLQKVGEINASYKRRASSLFYEDLSNGLDSTQLSAFKWLTSKIHSKDILGEEITREIYRNIKYLYINCKHVDTKYRVLTTVANTFITDWNERLPFTGLTTDMVVKKLIESIERHNGVVIIVLDEVDSLLKKSGDDTLYILSRLNEELKRSSTSLICISNDANVFNLIDARVNSSLSLDVMVFKPYNAVQLRDILKLRAEKAFYDGVYSSAVINLCAAYAARDNGDARRALTLLMVSGEVAETNNADNISEEHTRRALEKIETDSVSEVVRSLPLHPKLALLAIELQHEQGLNKITTGSVYESYAQLCRSRGITSLTKRRVSDFISELSTLGIIDANLISYGRDGRTRMIKLAACDNTIRDTLMKDDEIKPLLVQDVPFHAQRVQTRLI